MPHRSSEPESISISRRNFLQVSGAAAIGAAIASPLAASAAVEGHNPTPDAALKFTPDGKVLPFAGNTVICHVPHQSRFAEDATALRTSLMQAPFAHKLGILPPESYHMTVFPGANDQARQRSSWPGGVPMDAPIEECNRVMKQRMQKVQLQAQVPFRVRINAGQTMEYKRACTLRMEGADAAAEHALRVTRDQLAEVYQYHAADHATYGFHITLAYTMQDFTQPEMNLYQQILQRGIEQIASRTPVLELGLPEFCTFPDMYRFYPEVLLQR